MLTIIEAENETAGGRDGDRRRRRACPHGMAKQLVLGGDPESSMTLLRWLFEVPLHRASRSRSLTALIRFRSSTFLPMFRAGRTTRELHSRYLWCISRLICAASTAASSIGLSTESALSTLAEYTPDAYGISSRSTPIHAVGAAARSGGACWSRPNPSPRQQRHHRIGPWPRAKHDSRCFCKSTPSCGSLQPRHGV